jgi:uncharacterized membrane protein
MASGRLTPRLIIDGAVSFAFVPVFELVAFALVYRMRTRHLPSPDDVDRFFTTTTPWMFCIVALSALVSLQAPRDVARWTVPPLVLAPIGAIALAVVGAAYQDVLYFREELQQSTAAATRDAMLLRAITWPAAAMYFLGVAIWPHVVSWVRP